MNTKPMSDVVARRLATAARRLGTANPLPYVQPLIDRSFALPVGDLRYAANTLTPGAAPVEPSFSEEESGNLRFTIEPLGPDASPTARRDETTREMRRLVAPTFGANALRWFDEQSEAWRGIGTGHSLNYGAYFGSSYDSDGLFASKVYYEIQPNQVDDLPPQLAALARTAMRALPGLLPVFTSITCRRHTGRRRVTFVHHGALRLANLDQLMRELGMDNHLAGVLQVFGVSLGGRFELPSGSVLISLGQTSEGPELELYVLLAMLPDLPRDFINLLRLPLSERPQHLQALQRWLVAFTPEGDTGPGDFSILSIRTTPQTPPRISLYLRPQEFEISRHVSEAESNTSPVAHMT